MIKEYDIPLVDTHEFGHEGLEVEDDFLLE